MARFIAAVADTLTDSKLSNLMLQVEDETLFEDYENAEKQSPSERKLVGAGRSVYISRPFRKPRGHAYGPPVLCDFGEARIGSSHAWVEIQPDVYKAPEILMHHSHRNSKADIWNAGCVVSTPEFSDPRTVHRD